MGRAEDLFEKIKDQGIAAIDEFIETRQSEELYLDFKRSADNGGGIRLHTNDQKNLSKAISGFGNSEGGAVVWGVDCSNDQDGADVAHSKLPLDDCFRFKSLLEGSVSGRTIPVHNTVKHHAVPIDGGVTGFVVTLIPKSNHAPHHTVPDTKYYIRAGSDFVPTPHAVLAGMFGRRPQPNLYHNFDVSVPVVGSDYIELGLGLSVVNGGESIARDIFMNIMTLSKPGSNTEIMPDISHSEIWVGHMVYQTQLSLITVPEFRLAPEARHMPVSLKVVLRPPFTDDLWIQGLCGATNSPSYRFEIKQSFAEIQRLYDEFRDRSLNGPPLSGDEDHQYAAMFFGQSPNIFEDDIE